MRNDFKNPAHPARPKQRLRLPLIGLILIAVVIYSVTRGGSDDPITPVVAQQQPNDQPLALPAIAEPPQQAAADAAAPARQAGSPTTASETAIPREATALTAIQPRPAEHTAAAVPPTLATAVSTGLVQQPAAPAARSDPESPVSGAGERWLEETVKAGDSLARIFARLDLSPGLLHRIINSSNEAKTLARIRPGQTLKVHLDAQGGFLALIHQRSAIRSLRVVATDSGFATTLDEQALETRINQAKGTITNSLYQSAKRAGLNDSMIMELANIFGWDVDFALEIRAGDRFSLIYEEQYLNGKKYRNGPILAAEFVNRGKVFRAVRYQDEHGDSNYFAPDGSSMRKAFLRAPVDFRRISSRFTKARWHPVLGKKRPHRGVDYSAATGTPIKAAGDGRVIFRGRKGGYGNTIIIQHGSQYTTLYAHMSRFRKSVRKGSRVKQGQVIGYVGKTGLATGPHLHYEFRVNGVHRNPLTVKLPASAPIDRKYRSDFEASSRPLLARLDQLSSTIIAKAE